MPACAFHNFLSLSRLYKMHLLNTFNFEHTDINHYFYQNSEILLSDNYDAFKKLEHARVP